MEGKGPAASPKHVRYLVHIWGSTLNCIDWSAAEHAGEHMRTIAFTDARANFKRVIDQVVDDVDVTLITRRDAPNAIVMSQEHYDSLMETVHLLRSPANVAHLERSIGQLRAGKVKARRLAKDTE